jgi:hypothetical protein
LQQNLAQALDYIHKIEGLLKTDSNGHEQSLLNQLHTWSHTLEAMAQTLQYLAPHQALIVQDLGQLPQAIAALEAQIAAEVNPLLKQDLARMLQQRQHQQQALETLQTTRRRAAIQIDCTISVLGTIYSQLLTYRSSFHVVDYQQLTTSVSDEVDRLQDYLEALQEVRGGVYPASIAVNDARPGVAVPASDFATTATTEIEAYTPLD